MQFTNCTTRKLLFHDPYESYIRVDCCHLRLVSGRVYWTWMRLKDYQVRIDKRIAGVAKRFLPFY